MFKCKKGDLLGGEMMLWIYRFALIGLIVFSLIIVIFNFYSVKYDIRSSEALFIGKRITNCVSDEGIINRDILNKNNVMKCLDVDDDNDEIYINFNLKDFDEQEIANFDIGKNELKPLCSYDVYCSEQKYYFITDDDKMTKLELLIAIDKVEENA